jgi:hypothetical protein
MNYQRAMLSFMAVSIMVLTFSTAFSPIPIPKALSVNRRPAAAYFGIHSSRNRALFSQQETPNKEPGQSTTPVVVGLPSEPEGTSFPINLPSPILLSASMGLAIVSTGK